MRTLSATVAVVAAAVMFSSSVGHAQAWESCHSCTPTSIFTIFSNSHPGVPNPTRNGQFLGHFDANGVPQSIVTQSDSYVVKTEVPCPVFVWSWSN